MGGFLHAESEFELYKCQILHPEAKNGKTNFHVFFGMMSNFSGQMLAVKCQRSNFSGQILAVKF